MLSHYAILTEHQLGSDITVTARIVPHRAGVLSHAFTIETDAEFTPTLDLSIVCVAAVADDSTLQAPE